MANPTIQSIIPSANPVRPGQQFTVRILAVDPDERVGILKGIVQDADGNPADATVQIRISDPLSFSLVDVDGAGFRITQDAADPALFHVVAP